MWSYSASMFLGQWGIFVLLGVLVFVPVFGTDDWFGMMLPVGFVGGFGTAAAGGGVAGYGGPPPGTGATAPSRGDREEARAAGNLRAVIGPAVAVAGIPGVLPALRSALARARPGRLTDGEHTRGDTRAGEWVERLAAYPRADLLPTVREYLRHLGRWEDAARVLGVHRNTLRHRVGVAERLLGVTLTDPDVLAPLWLALATGDPS